MVRRLLVLPLLLLAVVARADDFVESSTRGMPGSKGMELRLQHPADWKRIESEDPAALIELRGPEGDVSGILQVARGRRRLGADAQCEPDRARSMLQHMASDEADARVTDLFARSVDGRPGYALRYERANAPGYLRVRSVIVCLKDTRVLVSCGASSPKKAALREIEPVCERVLESVRISEE
ncbi:hypothetical protein LZ009_02920 [Ramlibacter sp. XY19]|uniref:hypothetical protein n=1 Tax=Ramlibacter paludis TaxID=2908000 RepID=UPI0023DB522B|nr:hypothetical protein [Ramlibacter paludis]MCG2591725.1 hypothetical protein [Ramlibacter paludis]